MIQKEINSTVFMLRPKKRQFYCHNTTLRYMNPQLKHKLLLPRKSLPDNIGTFKKSLNLKRKKILSLMITDKSHALPLLTDSISPMPNLRKRLKPLKKSIDITLFTPDFESRSKSPHALLPKMDAYTSTL